MKVACMHLCAGNVRDSKERYQQSSSLTTPSCKLIWLIKTERKVWNKRDNVARAICGNRCKCRPPYCESVNIYFHAKFRRS